MCVSANADASMGVCVVKLRDNLTEKQATECVRVRARVCGGGIHQIKYMTAGVSPVAQVRQCGTMRKCLSSYQGSQAPRHVGGS